MKALILAAGIGNRMRPLTNKVHKTLLTVNGEAIIDRIIFGLLENGITRMVVVTGYRVDELVSHLQYKFPAVDFEFVHNPRFRETNNIYSMALAFEQIDIDDDILLIESDLIFLPEVIKRAIESPYPNVALVSPYMTGLDGTVVQLSGNKVVAIYPPHLQDEKFDLFDKFKTLNIYRFSKDFCANEFKKLLVYYAKTIDANCYYELILGILIYMQRQDIYCEIIANDQWAEVDDPNDLMGAEFLFNREKRLELLEGNFGGFWNFNVLDFCFIRNMYFPPKSMVSEIKNNLHYLIENYGSKQEVLNRKLSYVVQCDPERLIMLNGASQVYPILSNLLAGKSILLPEPTFGEYPRIFPGASTYGDCVGVSCEEVEAKLAEADVLVVVNPNNPTGSVVSTKWLIALAEKNAEKLFIIDESFIEFSDQPSVLSFFADHPLSNILLIKSMSKSYGIPGLRLGFVYSCQQELLAAIAKEVPIWNMNSIAEFYLEILLKNKALLAESFEQTRQDRKDFSQGLRGLALFDEVYPSGGDYILVRAAGDGTHCANLAKYLLVDHSIYIKEVTDKMGVDGRRYYRLAVRLPVENSLLLEAIKVYA